MSVQPPLSPLEMKALVLCLHHLETEVPDYSVDVVSTFALLTRAEAVELCNLVGAEDIEKGFDSPYSVTDRDEDLDEMPLRDLTIYLLKRIGIPIPQD